MKSLRIVLGAVALALMSSTALAQTPAPKATSTQGLFTPAPSPSPLVGKEIGSSSAWLKKLFVGTCTVNPGSIAAGASTLMTCTVTGAQTGDKAYINVRPPNSSTHQPFLSDECFVLQGGEVVANDTLQFRLINREMAGVQATLACDPPALTVDYMIFRVNPNP